MKVSVLKSNKIKTIDTKVEAEVNQEFNQKRENWIEIILILIISKMK